MKEASDQTEVRLGEGLLRIVRIAPGEQSLGVAIAKFIRDGGGYVTALNESALQLATNHVPENVEAEIKPFGHLGGIVCRLAGLPTHRVARRSLVEAAVAHACMEVGKIFKPRHGSNTVSQAVATTLSELRYTGATVGSLRELAESTSTPLQTRILELALILESSDGILRSLGLEHLSDQLRRVVESSPSDLPTFEIPERVLVFAVQDLMPLHASWLQWLARAGSDVTIVVESQAPGSDLFSRPLRLLGIEQTTTADATNNLASRLFLFEEQDAQVEPQVEVVGATDRLAECEWAIRSCLEALQAQGAEEGAMSKVMIAYRDEAYAPLLMAAAQRLKFPLRLSTRAPLLSNRLVAYVLGLLKAFASSDVRDLIPCLESAYSEMSPIQLELAKRSIREAYLKPDSWASVEEWANLPDHPAWLPLTLEWRLEALGLAAKSSDENFELSLFEDFEPIGNESNLAEEAVSAYEWLQRIRTLIEFLPVLDAEEHLATEWDNRAQTVLIQALADEVSVERARPRDPMTLKQAIEWCEAIWSRADCSVPAAPVGVRATSSLAGLPRVERLWMLGMSDGRFPKRASADPVLPDWERKELQGLGLDLLTSIEKHHGREREDFVRVCSAPSQSLTLSYPLSLDDRGAGPSSFVTEAKRAAGEFTERLERGLVPELDQCLAEADLKLRLALDGERRFPQEVVVSKEIAVQLSKGPTPTLKLREINDARGCSFRFQALQLKVLEEGLRDFGAALPWLPMKVNLPLIANREDALQALDEALDQSLERLRGQAEPWELRLYRLQGKRYVRELVEREFAAREIWPRTISPGASQTFALRQPLGDHAIIIKDSFAVVGEMDGRASYHLYRWNPLRRQDNATALEGEIVEALLADYVAAQGGGGIIEVDSRAKREVFGAPVPVSKMSGARGMPFRKSDDPNVTKALNEAAAAAVSGQMTPQPSYDGCRYCDFGELCRRSKSFSEVVATLPPTEEDPFAN